jgi:hypothetical protein
VDSTSPIFKAVFDCWVDGGFGQITLASLCQAEKVADNSSRQLFRFMRPNYLHTHLESVALLWKVADATSPRVIGNAIMKTLLNEHTRAEGLRSFAQLWNLTGEFQMSLDVASH